MGGCGCGMGEIFQQSLEHWKSMRGKSRIFEADEFDEEQEDLLYHGDMGKIGDPKLDKVIQKGKSLSAGSIGRRKLLNSAKEAFADGLPGASRMPYADCVDAEDSLLDSSTSSSEELSNPGPIRRRCDGAPKLYKRKLKVCAF